MTAAEPVTHVRLDQRGVAWIDGTKVKVVEVIADHLAFGLGAEEIHLQHPHLSLSQIHAALAYYFDHQSKMDDELERRFRRVEQLRKKSRDQPSRRALLARLNRR